MPVELWLECICDATSPGEELVVVGNHACFGNWDPAQGVVLRTGRNAFPRWTVRAPVLLAEDPAALPRVLEYKYVMRESRQPVGRSRRCTWEDLGMCAVPKWSDGGERAVTSAPWHFESQPLNRRLKPNSIRDHSVVMRLDHFGVCSGVAEASWAVSPQFGPHRAGFDTWVGPRGSTSISDLSAVHLAVLDTTIMQEIFVRRRRCCLLAALQQLRRNSGCPADVWRYVEEFVSNAPAKEAPDKDAEKLSSRPFIFATYGSEPRRSEPASPLFQIAVS